MSSDRKTPQRMNPPYNREEAERLRKAGQHIVACFECLREDKAHPYWPFYVTHFAGAAIYCPKHFDEVSFGRVRIGELPPLGP